LGCFAPVLLFLGRQSWQVKVLDVFLFIFFPIACGPSFVYSFHFFFPKDVLNGLLSFYSVLFSILLGSITFVAGEMSSSSSAKNVPQETIFSLFVTILFSFLCCIALVIGLFLESDEGASMVITSLVISFSASSFFQLLSILKKELVLILPKGKD
jgi:hypothetical protein